MSFRRSGGSETDEVINHRPEKKLKSGTVEDKTFVGVVGRPVRPGSPAQHSVPAGGPKEIAILVPPPSMRYRQPIMAPAVPWGRPAQHSVPARGPRGFAQLVPPPSIRYRQPIMATPVPLYLKSGMKRDYSPPPEETPTESLPEDQKTMSPYPDDDRFRLLTRHPKMINGLWIEYPPILIPKEDHMHEFVLEEEPPWAGRYDLGIVSKPCGICSGKYGKHHWAACPLGKRCGHDEEVGKDFEVVCVYHAIPDCARRCFNKFGRAAVKIKEPLI